MGRAILHTVRAFPPYPSREGSPILEGSPFNVSVLGSRSPVSNPRCLTVENSERSSSNTISTDAPPPLPPPPSEYGPFCTGCTGSVKSCRNPVLNPVHLVG